MKDFFGNIFALVLRVCWRSWRAGKFSPSWGIWVWRCFGLESGEIQLQMVHFVILDKEKMDLMWQSLHKGHQFSRSFVAQLPIKIIHNYLYSYNTLWQLSILTCKVWQKRRKSSELDSGWPLWYPCCSQPKNCRQGCQTGFFPATKRRSCQKRQKPNQGYQSRVSIEAWWCILLRGRDIAPAAKIPLNSEGCKKGIK